jgi:class 3 adenylate cyclase/ActR/RegA family two-component response regulator
MSGDAAFTTQLRHELRTQLNHVLGYAELLLEAGGDSAADSFAARVAAIADAGARAAAGVDDLRRPIGLSVDITVAAIRRALEDVLATVGELLRDPDGWPSDEAVLDLLRIQAAARYGLALATDARVMSRLSGQEHDLDAGDASDEPVDVEITPAGFDASATTVLVVDDDEANRDVLARRLDHLGYRVRTATSGREGLEILRAGGADLVLLDLMMPDMNGYEVLEACRDDATLREVPIIMISARDDIDDVVECITLGAEDFLPKPFDPVLLEARVGASAEKKQLRDEQRSLLAMVQEQAATLAEWNATLEAKVRDQVAEIGRLNDLRRFLSPQVTDAILSSGDKDILKSHRSKIAVLFCDLRGFTAFAETAEPEEVMALLGGFHEVVGALIHQFGATVGFFAGDGLMVFFNDPIPCPDPAARAVRLAVAMREAMADVTGDWAKRGYDVGFSIGVTLGYATLGEMGFEGRYDYGVIGSVVNMASRLCDQAGIGEIVISRPARVAVEDFVETEDIGTLTLKGFHAPVPAYRVRSIR